jgi:hypothetical protein
MKNREITEDDINRYALRIRRVCDFYPAWTIGISIVITIRYVHETYGYEAVTRVILRLLAMVQEDTRAEFNDREDDSGT